MSIFAFSLAVIGIIVIILGLTGIIPGPHVNIGNQAKVTETGTRPSLPINQDQVQVREITESSQNSSTTNESSKEKEYIWGTWKYGTEPFIATLSFNYSGTYEYNVGTQGKGGIEYYVKGNIVYVDVYDDGNYKELMKITSNGDIIFDGKTFKKQYKKY